MSQGQKTDPLLQDAACLPLIAMKNTAPPAASAPRRAVSEEKRDFQRSRRITRRYNIYKIREEMNSSKVSTLSTSTENQ